MNEARLKIVIDALNQTSGELDALKSDLKGVDDAGRQASSGIGGTNDALEQLTGVSLTSAGAIAAVGAALKYSIDQAAEAERITAQTEAVIRSTGGAAGYSADEIGRMAGQLADVSTFADDAIQSGQNILLTFTGIGRDALPLASQAMIDMAQAMNMDLKGAAMQLGKALNDPAEGLSALTRNGVVFTAEQEKMIKALQASGDTFGAQKIIIAELNKEFGGSAAAALDTYSGKLAQLQKTVDNLAESIGGDFITVLSTGTEWVNKFSVENAKGVETLARYASPLLQAVSAAAEWINANETAIKTQTDLEQSIRVTATSYDDYISKLAEASGQDADYAMIQADLERGLIDKNEAMRQAADLLGAQSQIIFDANQATLAYGESLDESERATRRLTAGVQDSAQPLKTNKEILDANKAAISGLNDVIRGSVGNELKSFAEKQTELKDKAQELGDKIDKLEGKRYLTPTQKEELQKTRDDLQDVNEALETNAQKHEDAMRRIVFSMLTQQAAADGFTTAEVTALTTVAEKWGLIDPATKQATDGISTALDAANKDGNWDKFYQRIDTVTNKLLGIPTNINVNIGVNTRYTTSGKPSAAAGDMGLTDAPVIIKPEKETTPATGGFATGGTFTVPGIGSGDRMYSVPLTPGETVSVTPVGQTQGSGTWTGDINLYGVNDPQAFIGTLMQLLVDRGIAPRNALR